MKIKTRLTLFNILIIGISTFIIIFIFGFIANNLMAKFYNTSVLTIDENIEKIKEIVDGDYTYSEISKELESYDYSFVVYNNKELVYGKEVESITKIINNSTFDENKISTLYVDHSTAVFNVENNNILIAYQNNHLKEYFGELRDERQIFIIKFIIVSLVSLSFVLFIAFLFSRIIIKRIMKPTLLLSEGAKRVKSGNYNENIVYKNNDEFDELIDNFNDMQKHLKEETEKNKRYQESKLEMINGINHDIRTPLTAVKGYIKGIQDGIANTDEKRKQYLSIAYKRTMDIERLLNNLFDTFNYETGEIKLDKTKTDILKFINDFVKNKEDELTCKNVKINVNKLSTKEFVYIDKVQFSRVFENLLNNAIKYSKTENLVIDIKIWREKGNIKISFKDNGIGVKEENLKYLFNEFYKEDNSRTNSKENGSGLGLFIVKTIVESHNGTISVKNKKGLYFEITLKGECNE